MPWRLSLIQHQGGEGKKYIGDGCLVCLCKRLQGDGGFMFFDAELFPIIVLYS